MTAAPTDLTLLDTMLADMASADILYRPTSFWEAASQRLIEELREQGIESFRSQIMPLRFFVPTYGFPGYHRTPAKYQPVYDGLESATDNPARPRLRLAEMMSGEQQAMADYRVFRASDTDTAPFISEASESRIGRPLEQFEFEGRRYSRSFLNYMLGINFVKKHCDTRSLRRVAEIGGGHGALGELLLADRRNEAFYLDIDIPPTSFVATWYLEQVLGKDRVYGYQESGSRTSLSIDDIAGDHDAAVVCPWQLPLLEGTIDLFVNFVSFQEMEPDVVRNYLAQVERLSPRYILLRNMREGKQVARKAGDVGVQEPILGEYYDSYLPGFKLVATNVTPFGHLTEDGFHSELRLYERR